MTEPTATNARLDGIAETAARLFLDKGYDAASMADLAAATGLGKSSLYHHLSSKDQLLAHICGRPLGELHRELAAAAALPEPAGVRLARALEQVTRIALGDVPASNLALTVKPTTEAARRIHDERHQVERALAELVAAAQAEGAARTDVEPVLLTRLVMGTINGLVTWYRPETSEVPPDVVGEAVLALMLSAVEMK
jgi:AcrR family transcriptional regulator